MPGKYDAVIIGSGTNGLAAGIRLQQQGLKTIIFEQEEVPGGATRTEELTLPGFLHDVGSAILPLGLASPFLSKLPLEDHGLEWIFPEIPFAHPFADGTAHACYQGLEATAAQLGTDQQAYLDLFGPLLENWEKVMPTILGPLSFPKHPLEFLKFGLKALPSARNLVMNRFQEEKTRLLFYGAAAHSTLPLNSIASASFGLVLSLSAHKYHWPFPKGGAGKFTQALLSYYKSLGGELQLNTRINEFRDLPNTYAYLFDLTPKQLLNIGGLDFPWLYRKRMQRYRYGAGVFKMDWALSEPIPFSDPKARRAGTVHLGFSTDEMEMSESRIHNHQISNRPYVLVSQHTSFDGSRAPAGGHTAWAYCHVPHGSVIDFTREIEAQIERAAPGFKDVIMARSVKNTEQLEQWNPNLIGGDINGGIQDLTQLFTRPIAKISPYATPNPRIYICSSSTPPGGGVHGMCGYHAAEKVIKDHF